MNEGKKEIRRQIRRRVSKILAMFRGGKGTRVHRNKTRKIFEIKDDDLFLFSFSVQGRVMWSNEGGRRSMRRERVLMFTGGWALIGEGGRSTSVDAS